MDSVGIAEGVRWVHRGKPDQFVTLKFLNMRKEFVLIGIGVFTFSSGPLEGLFGLSFSCGFAVSV